MSSALKTLTAAVASAVLLSSAGMAAAAGLGKLTVLSALGQPLRAEIELTSVSNQEAAGLVAKLATPEAYRAANIEFNPALLSLRFNVEQRAGRQFIRITSTQPLNEPFVDLLLELAWDNGRLVREYTFLLDPAELRAPQPAQVAAAPAPAERQRAATPAPAAQAPAQSAQPAPAPVRPQRSARAEEGAAAADAAPRAPAAASRYRVKSGDTLSRIATRVKPVDVSLDMMLVALYRANPEAFIGNNMNRLKSGQILSVPDADALRGIDAGEAHGTVVAHAADFNAYRAKLAGQVATSTPARETPGGQSATGRITAKVEERPTAANESQDQLRLSKALPAPAAGGGDKAGAADTTRTSAEDTIAREKELAEAQQRVKELEKNVNQLEELMTVKSGAGAAATQRAAEGMKPIAPADAPAANTAATTADTKPAPKIKPKAKPAPKEKSLLDTLMDNIVYIGAGAAVLLLAALGVSQRRRKQAAPKAAAAEPSILGAAAQPSGQALFAETGGQSVDTNDSVFNSSFAPSASQLDTNEVDPLAEAELYLAYNFDTQAEDILKEALRNDPHRHPVRLKLLEIYAARKDVRAFETQATELYSLTGGKGDEWAQAAAMGHALDPANPMYATAAGTGIGAAAGATLAAGAAGAAAAFAPEPNPQSLLSLQLEQAFRNRGESSEIIEPAATLDAVTGAPLDTSFNLDSLGLGNDATALPQAGADAKAEAKLDDNLLDFDLGGLSFEPVQALDPAAAGRNDATAVPDLQFDMEPFAPLEPAAATTAAAAPAASLDDLAFDMDFDPPAGESASARQAAEPGAPGGDEGFVLDLSSSGPTTDIDMAQLAKEFELPPLPAVPQTPQDANLKDPLFDLDAMDFSLADDTPVTPATPVAPKQDFDFSTDLDFATPAVAEAPVPAQAKDPLFDLDTMDFGQPAAPAAPQDDPFALPDVPAIPNPGTPVPRFDMSGFDLDLPASDVATETAAQEQGAAVELTPAQMEMETKLDLAIAYQEIGDKEGARELLDEVIKGGSVEQASRASAMRAKLA